MSAQSDEAKSVYAGTPGGVELIAWFGGVPSFHDAEIVELSLHRQAASVLRVHTWITGPEVDEQKRFVLSKHAVVAFTLHGIMDLQIDGFSHQNVISELIRRRAPDRPERLKFYSIEPSPNDLEIELGPCFGLDGRIRCQTVQIGLAPGQPVDVGG